MNIKSRLTALEAAKSKGKECTYAQFVIAARTGAKLAAPPKKGSLMDYMMQKYNERMNGNA